MAIQKDNGDLISVQDNRPISQEIPSAMTILLSIFNIKGFNSHIFFFHSPLVHMARPIPNTGCQYNIKAILSGENIKEAVFPLKFLKGLQAKVGRNFLFCNGDSLEFTFLSEDLIPSFSENSLKYLDIHSDLPYSFNNEKKVISIDLQNIPLKSITPLILRFDVHDFLRKWTYHSQRFIYQFSLAKV